MKTTIEYRDGTTEVHEDACPNISPEDREVVLCDHDAGVVAIIPMNDVTRVVFDV